MKKKMVFALAAALSLSSLTACADDTYPIEVESSLGTTVIEDEVNAVAVFDLGMLDILDTLGFGDKVVAVTHGVAFPDYLSEYLGEYYIDLGGFKTWDEAALEESNPDLIFAGFRQNKSIDTVTAIAPTLYFEEPSAEDASFLDVVEQKVNAVTTIFGGEEKAAGYLEEIKENAEEQRGGRGEGAEGREEGGREENAEEQRGGREEGAEGQEEARGEGEGDPTEQNAESAAYIIEQNPDYLLVFDKDAAEVEEDYTPAQEIIESVGLEGTNAYDNGRIVYLDNAVWYSAGGGLTAAIRQLDDVMELLGIE